MFTDDPVNEIVDRNGYTNMKLFYSKFREKYGMTPGEVRKLHDTEQK